MTDVDAPNAMIASLEAVNQNLSDRLDTALGQVADDELVMTELDRLREQAGRHATRADMRATETLNAIKCLIGLFAEPLAVLEATDNVAVADRLRVQIREIIESMSAEVGIDQRYH